MLKTKLQTSWGLWKPCTNPMIKVLILQPGGWLMPMVLTSHKKKKWSAKALRLGELPQYTQMNKKKMVILKW